MAVLVYKIAGVDVSAFVEKGSVSVTNALTQKIDSARLRLVGKTTEIDPKSPEKIEI